MTAIKIETLVKIYGKIRALDGLNLQVETGSIFGFLGPNGAGKTTTLRILAGLAKPDSGSIVMAENRDLDYRWKIGYLPEEPSFYPWMTPLEYLDYVGKIFHIDQKQRNLRASQLLEQCGLHEASNRRIGGFSRGMRQRLGLAQAMMNQPEILLLDEPVSALDPAGRKEVLEMIDTLKSSCTVIMSSHILADVERVCDTVAIIHHGRLATQDKMENLMEKYATPALELTIGNSMIAHMQEWKTRLKNLSNVTGVTSNGYTIHLTVKDVFSAQQQILQDALAHRYHFEKLEIVKPSLEDIFMQLTGSTR